MTDKEIIQEMRTQTNWIIIFLLMISSQLCILMWIVNNK